MEVLYGYGRKLHVKKADQAKDLIRKYSRDFDGSLSDAECIRLIGISRNTYYKYKKAMSADPQSHGS